MLTNLIAMVLLAAAGDVLAQCLEGITTLADVGVARVLVCPNPSPARCSYADGVLRAQRFMTYRLTIYAPLFIAWNTFLEHAFPAPMAEVRPGYERVEAHGVGELRTNRTETRGIDELATAADSASRQARRVLSKVFLDALLFTPVSQITFYIFLAFAEGCSLSEGWARCLLILPRSLPASYAFWTPVQCLTFSVVPTRHRIVWVQSVCLWNIAASTFNQSAAAGGGAPAAGGLLANGSRALRGGGADATAALPSLPAPGLEEAAEAASNGGPDEMALLRIMYEWCIDTLPVSSRIRRLLEARN